MLSHHLVSALIIASASVGTAAPAGHKAASAVLDAGDALELRMAALEAKEKALDSVDKVEQLGKERIIQHEAPALANATAEEKVHTHPQTARRLRRRFA